MITRIIHSTYFKPTIFVMILAVLSLSFTLPQEKVILPSGTNVPLQTMSEVDSQNIATGQIIDFMVQQDVRVNGQVVIKSGTIAKGMVTRVRKNGAIGRPGEVDIQIRSVTAVDGQEIFLMGSNLSDKGDDRQALSIILGVFVCIFCLFIKGKSATIPAGTQVVARVGTESVITI